MLVAGTGHRPNKVGGYSAKFTAEDIIAVYELRRKTSEFIALLRPMSLLDKFDKVPPMLNRGSKIKIRS